MSFKLFFLSTFKGLKNTREVENKLENLRADFQQYITLQDSQDLKVYQKLDQYINSEVFKTERSEIRSIKFAGSPEARMVKELRKLESDKKLKAFYATQHSADFQKYQLLEKSDVIKKYVNLRDYVESKKYESDKSEFNAAAGKGGADRFEETAAHKKFMTYQELSKSQDVLFWEAFPSTKAHKNYKEIVNSSKRVRYEELKAEVESNDFKIRRDFLEDSRRWEKTEAFRKEKEYNEMKSQPRFQVYEKYKDSDAFSFFLNHELLLEDHFEDGKLDKSKWQPISPQAENTVGRNFSKVDDLQAYTNGENVMQNNSSLRLAVKQEKADSMVWNFPLGFVPVSFDYSAGLICSVQKFKVKSGVLEAKIKYQPNKQLVDLFYLSDDKNNYRLNLLEAGTVCRFGVDHENSSQHESLSDLSAGQFYIFRIEWGQGRICWKINDLEIYSVEQSVPDVPLRINMSSIVVERPYVLPHYFEVDWVRLYRKN